MGTIAIRVENLSKKYRIGRRKNYTMLKDNLINIIDKPFRVLKSSLNGRPLTISDLPSNNYIWALKEINFEVRTGEIVGIIGRNGSGKSTLLKILSRITVPTDGYAEVWGRIRSLLEVGTGFHYELTGRENIYLNGAILGMRKREIDSKFDEIVAFSEVERFIDTPVKHYSSGMSMRLAFAVAAYLDSEILIIDEVLAVGDASFKKKCLEKISNAAKEGRTVIFVSHDMDAIRLLCEKAIFLDNGKLIDHGDTDNIIHRYLQSSSKLENISN